MFVINYLIRMRYPIEFIRAIFKFIFIMNFCKFIKCICNMRKYCGLSFSIYCRQNIYTFVSKVKFQMFEWCSINKNCFFQSE